MALQFGSAAFQGPPGGTDRKGHHRRGPRGGIAVVNGKRKALEQLAALRAADPAPISGRDALLINQISFYDDPMRMEPILKDKGIPPLALETGCSMEDIGQLKTRVEAFMETLE